MSSTMKKLILFILLGGFYSHCLAEDKTLDANLNISKIANSLNQQANQSTLSEAINASNHLDDAVANSNELVKTDTYTENLVEVPFADEELAVKEEPFDMESHIEKIRSFHASQKPKVKLTTSDINQLEKSGNFIKALEKAESAYTSNPNNEATINLLGRLLVKNNNPHKAIELLQPLAKDSNSNWQPWFWLGSAYLLTNDYNNAEFYLDEALAREGNQSAIWVQRAIVEQQKGNTEATIHFLQVANNLSPNNPEVLVNFAYASEKIGELDKSIQAYKRFLQASASQRSFGRLRSQIMLRISQIEQAKRNQAESEIQLYDIVVE
jgi:tetratricopeptide (TPR) repeat protein